MYLYRSILIICALFGLTCLLKAQPVKDSQVTLSKEMLDTSIGISLQGDWKFRYKSESTDDFGESFTKGVPNSWINYEVGGKLLPSMGYGLYAITIHNPENIRNLVLLLYGVSVEYKITANGQVIHRSKDYLPPYERKGVPVRSRDVVSLPNAAKIDLQIEVSNHIHVDGGLTRAPVIGINKTMLLSERNRSNFEMVQIGCLLLMAFYNLILFFQFRDWAYLHLSLLCFVVLIRGLIVYDGSLMLYALIPAMDYNIGKKLEYFLVYSTIFLPPLFLQTLFKNYTFRKFNWVLIGIGLIMMGVVLVTPTHVFTATLNFYHIMMLPSYVVVFAILWQSIRAKKVGAVIATMGIALNFLFIAVEILINSGLVEIYHGGPNLVNTGTVVFLFVQSVVISRVFAHYRMETAKKSVELARSEYAKQTIEQELEDKEKELADYTLNMIHRNKLLDDMETIMEETKENKEPQSVTSLVNKFSRLISLNRQSNNQWDDFNRYFGNVHKGFFDKLKDTYPELSSNDLRHCALIKMNLSLKESAEILAVDVGSVKVARYRMKRKIGLSEEDDLRQVISTF